MGVRVLVLGILELALGNRRIYKIGQLWNSRGSTYVSWSAKPWFFRMSSNEDI